MAFVSGVTVETLWTQTVVMVADSVSTPETPQLYSKWGTYLSEADTKPACPDTFTRSSLNRPRAHRPAVSHARAAGCWGPVLGGVGVAVEGPRHPANPGQAVSVALLIIGL